MGCRRASTTSRRSPPRSSRGSSRARRGRPGGPLVLAEALRPSHGLQRGVHYLEVGTRAELEGLIARLAREPGAFTEIQAAGRREAERFRASAVYPGLLRDALADIAAGPSGRR